MLRMTVVIGVLIAASLHGAAIAQMKPESRTGSRFVESPGQVSQDLTNLMLSDYAVCLVKKRRRLVSTFVTDRSTLRLGRKYQPLLDPDCLNGPALADEYELSLDTDAIRYALADALLREKLADINPAALSGAPQLAVPVFGTVEVDPNDSKTGAVDVLKLSEQQAVRDQASIIMFKFGDCAVRANPMGAQGLLRAAPGSSDEDTAVQAFLPTLQSCLEKGSQVALNKVKLRGAVATSYYSLAIAANALR